MSSRIDIVSALFRAYFSEGMDIGDLEVLTQIGNESGLDRDTLVQVLQTGRYRPKIENMRKEAPAHTRGTQCFEKIILALRSVRLREKFSLHHDKGFRRDRRDYHQG